MKSLVRLCLAAALLFGLAIAYSASAAGEAKFFVNHKGNIICVAESSIPAHIAHGDVTRMMPCP